MLSTLREAKLAGSKLIAVNPLKEAGLLDNIQEIVNLLLLRGMLGKPGAGACPCSGTRTCRAIARWASSSGRRREQGDGRSLRLRIAEPPRSGRGRRDPRDARRQAARVLRARRQLLSATPDSEVTARALQNCHLTAHVSTKLNRAHLITGERAMILPCFGRTEQDPSGFVTVEDSMSAVHSSQGGLEPASDSILPEPSIVARLARATLGAKSTVDWERLSRDYDAVRELMSETIPGFQDFNARVREPRGFYLPNTARERDFAGLGGKAKLTCLPLPRFDLEPDQLL